MTYIGRPYYPEWLDNLAEDVALEAAAMDGTAHGAEDVRTHSWPSPANSTSTRNSTTPVRAARRVTSRTTHSSVRGMPTDVIVLVDFNATGQTQHVVVNHRPRSAMLQFSRVMLEKFVTPHMGSTGEAHLKEARHDLHG